MVWKMATCFVLTAETWVGADGEDALFIIGVSRHERLAALQRIKHGNLSPLASPCGWRNITSMSLLRNASAWGDGN